MNQVNSENLFPHALKLYVFRDRQMTSLSLRSSAFHVVTFYFSIDEFNDMVAQHATPLGFDTERFFILQKYNFLRFTQKCGTHENEFRVNSMKWKAMITEYKEKSKSSEENILTIVIT